MPRRWISRIAAAALCALLQACATAPLSAPAPMAAPAEARSPVTILISIDGFRPDYLDRGVTPVLSGLAADGVRAAMRPSFPSKTFPNHWTIVTGVVPDRHGIVANRMEDQADPENVFTMATDDPAWWTGPAPIWVDAEQAGIRTATMFWPGSNVQFGGVMAKDWPHDISGGTRPSDWAQYNEAITGPQRVQGVLDWLRRPAAIRPRFVTLYFDTVDTAGHQYGPDDPRTTAAVADVDRTIGMLVGGLKALDQPANLLIVSDHGMAAKSGDRAIVLDTILPQDSAHIVEANTFVGLWALPGHETEVERALLKPRDHLRCWPKAQIPARFRYGTNPRIPPWFCLADVGWVAVKTAEDKPDGGGDHGWDNQAPEMAAVFIAHGPAFAHGRTLPEFDNVDVEPLLRDLIGLPQAEGIDGTDMVFRGVLAR